MKLQPFLEFLYPDSKKRIKKNALLECGYFNTKDKIAKQY